MSRFTEFFLLTFFCFSLIHYRVACQSIHIQSIANDRQIAEIGTGDNGYTLDGIRMAQTSRLKLLSPDNFGINGIYPKSVALIEKYAESGSLEQATNIPIDHIFFFGAFSPIDPNINDFTQGEIDSLYNWSLRGGKLIIASGGYLYEDGAAIWDHDILREKWEYEFIRMVPSPLIPTTEGAGTSLFDGPFGAVAGVLQSGLLQGYFSSIPDHSKVLATNFDFKPTLYLDCHTLDLIIADVDVFTDIGGVTQGDSIQNGQDIFWVNTIAFMDRLQGKPEIAHYDNSLVLNYTYNSYTWYKDGVPVGTDSILSNPQPGEYIVETTVNGGCEVVSDTFQINCLSFPEISLGPDTLVCRRNTLTLNTNSDNSTFEWQDQSSDSLYIVSETGVYWVKVTNECATVIDSIYVQFTKDLDLGKDTALCQGMVFLLEPDIPGGTFLWSDGSTGKSLEVTSTGLYWAEVADLCGTRRDSIHVKFDNPVSLDLGNDTTLCPGEVLVLDASNDNATYQWQDGSTAPFYHVSSRGNYTVRVTNACNSILDYFKVEYHNQLNLGSDMDLCDGDQQLLEVYIDGATYQWQNGNTSSHYLVEQAGTYWVQRTDPQCGLQSDTVVVTYRHNPEFEFSAERITCLENGYVIDATFPDATYFWQDGSTEPIYITDIEGYYSVIVTVNGCRTFDEISLSKNSCPPNLILPNVFTPNQDGINDIFTPIKSENIEALETRIFTRSGELIYQTDNLSIGWTGNLKNGDKVPPGVYFYYIKYVDLVLTQHQFKGTITVMY